MITNRLHQQQYDFNRHRWELSNRDPINYEKKRISEYISNPDYRKEYRKHRLIVKSSKSQQYLKFLYKNITDASLDVWKILKEDKYLIRLNFYHFMDIIFDLRGRIQFNSKIDFINYLLANPSLLSNLILEYFKSLKRYIIQDKNRITYFERFNPNFFQSFCYRNLSVKPIIKYENIQEPENFHIITKDDDIYFESEESYKLFLKELENVRFDEALARFYTKRNHKIKSKIK
ncbi:hypothetical protein LCGC14_0757200 [marine sediment metagenome]|uniref:Uncharacterized protein n=1 Tax=marine sediment metagenome TaxID=412755 RepID=A0A0F9Q2A7_9ZZZZ|nr:MAG: hypothetical protein Lokiarch_17570 [Candidatus Lokiarchaeum sp. GC14_75]HEC39347.1 hypothetical protein [bacterium]